MPATHKFRLRHLMLLTTLPALLIGALLWGLAELVPACSTAEHARLTAPDGAFDLVVFSHSCGPETGANMQAVLIPTGESLPDDAASFFSVASDADLAPRWLGADQIELVAPPGAHIYRQDDSVAGIAVLYR